ncbi:solute:sodium symporter family transporter [Chitinophaga agrisoli]|uniref:Solute:sodium symporter family transporter n=1 Tax=Chitinophaga agrisoli TaxID=2607653 RepID=A0A5B2VWJ4_9BACT|nr:solute:sodium symporter family transporter [Chitinophaga agrisoli]KAA2242627.1 solute:sodium symporter family transporter [Chitinophaga agrisoli]
MNATTLLTFLLITGTIGVISWYQTRKERLNTIVGFFLANRNLGFIAVGSGLLFANINTVLFVGENELVYANNMSVIGWGMTSVAAMLIVSEFIMPIYLRTGIATTPDYLERRYDSSVKRIVSLIFLVNYIVNLLPSVLYGGAVAFNGLFHFSDHYGISYWSSIWILVWIMGTVGGLYCLLGGLRAIAVSDVLLGAAMFTGGILLPWFGLRYLGHGNISEGLAVILSSKTEHMRVMGGPKDSVPFSTLFTGMLLVNLYYWGTEQYIVQQVLGSRNLAVCQKGIALACFGKILSPLLINIPGLIAVHMYSSLHNTAEVFPRMVSDVSPPVFVGYMAAILFGATFTTYNAGLNSASTLFILNVYKPWLEKQQRMADDRQLLRVAKRFELSICLLAMFIAPFIIFAKGGFYNYLQMVGGFFSVPIFTILLVGFLTRRVPPLAAKVGLAFFILSYGFTQTVFPTGLHFLHVLAILFVITCVIMLVIGRIYPLPVPYVPVVSNVVDVAPWKGRHVWTVALLAMMVGVYVLFTLASRA